MRTNHRLAQLWLDALATELGAAAGTIDTYTDDLNCYLVWLDESSLGLEESALSTCETTSPLSISAAMPDRRSPAASQWFGGCTVSDRRGTGSRDPTAT